MQTRSLGLKDPLEYEIPTPVFLPGEFHGQRSLVGYSPWPHRESDLIEHGRHALGGYCDSKLLCHFNSKIWQECSVQG